MGFYLKMVNFLVFLMENIVDINSFYFCHFSLVVFFRLFNSYEHEHEDSIHDIFKEELKVS